MEENFEVREMPHHARQDVAGTLHHIMLRGIEKKRISDDDLDREGFVTRMGKLALEIQTKIDAWSLLSNHLLLRSGPR